MVRSFLWVLILTILGNCQSELSGQGLNSSILTKIKKGNLGSNIGGNPDLQPKIAASVLIQDSSYTIGPGDALNVYLGSPNVFTISPEGFISLPGIPPIQVGGKTLKNSKIEIKRLLFGVYDTSKVSIYLNSPNTYKVALLGEIVNPGVKVVTSFSRLEDLLAYGGGFTKNALRSRITILHSDGDTELVHLTDYFKHFSHENNPLIKFGDRVIVRSVDFDSATCLVRIGSETYTHQIFKNESFRDICFQVNNYSQTFMPKSLIIHKRNGNLVQVLENELGSKFPESGDTLEYEKEQNFVFVGGAVIKPGMYEYLPNYSVDDYFYFAGVTPQSADTKKFTLIRNQVFIDGTNVKDFSIKPGDKIYLGRSQVESTRDYLSIFASLAGIIISSVTLYVAFNTSK